jgi:hypothetical protein
MPTNEPNAAGNWVQSRALVAEYQLNLPIVLRQLRLWGSSLGSVLEILETYSLSPDMVEQIGDCSTDATADVERLWNLIRPSI